MKLSSDSQLRRLMWAGSVSKGLGIDPVPVQDVPVQDVPVVPEVGEVAVVPVVPAEPAVGEPAVVAPVPV